MAFVRRFAVPVAFVSGVFSGVAVVPAYGALTGSRYNFSGPFAHPERPLAPDPSLADDFKKLRSDLSADYSRLSGDLISVLHEYERLSDNVRDLLWFRKEIEKGPSVSDLAEALLDLRSEQTKMQSDWSKMPQVFAYINSLRSGHDNMSDKISLASQIDSLSHCGSLADKIESIASNQKDLASQVDSLRSASHKIESLASDQKDLALQVDSLRSAPHKTESLVSDWEELALLINSLRPAPCSTADEIERLTTEQKDLALKVDQLQRMSDDLLLANEVDKFQDNLSKDLCEEVAKSQAVCIHLSGEVMKELREFSDEVSGKHKNMEGRIKVLESVVCKQQEQTN